MDSVRIWHQTEPWRPDSDHFSCFWTQREPDAAGAAAGGRADSRKVWACWFSIPLNYSHTQDRLPAVAGGTCFRQSGRGALGLEGEIIRAKFRALTLNSQHFLLGVVSTTGRLRRVGAGKAGKIFPGKSEPRQAQLALVPRPSLSTGPSLGPGCRLGPSTSQLGPEHGPSLGLGPAWAWAWALVPAWAWALGPGMS